MLNKDLLALQVTTLSLDCDVIEIITSPARAVAKYYDEHVCLSVCLSVRQDISGTHARAFVHVAYGGGSVLLRPINHCKCIFSSALHC